MPVEAVPAQKKKKHAGPVKPAVIEITDKKETGATKTTETKTAESEITAALQQQSIFDATPTTAPIKELGTEPTKELSSAQTTNEPKVEPAVKVERKRGLLEVPKTIIEETPKIPYLTKSTESQAIQGEPETVADYFKAAYEADINEQEDDLSTEELNIPEQPQPIVYADSQIVVKIKPTKRSGDQDGLKSENKRGRKSFKEIDASIDLIDIPDEKTLQKKLYYTISEVAGWFKVNTSLLRYWENEFDILQPRKTRKGDRLFRIEDIKNLQLIYFLLRHRKFSIEGAKSYLKNNKQKVDTETQLVKSLTGFKSFLLELRASLEKRA